MRRWNDGARHGRTLGRVAERIVLPDVALFSKHDRERDRACCAVYGDLASLRSDDDSLELQRVSLDELEHPADGRADVGRDTIGGGVTEPAFANVYHAMR